MAVPLTVGGVVEMGFLRKLRGRPLNRDEGDRRVIEQLRRSGSDLSRPSRLRHYLYGRTKGDAEHLAERLREDGYQVTVRPAAKGKDWLALATNRMVLTPESIRETRGKLESLAASIGAEYDGWEAALNK